MSKIFVGDACAYLRKEGEEKARYPRIGAAFKDDSGRISIKIDTLPIGNDWQGWINIFPREKGAQTGDSKEFKNNLRRVNEALGPELDDERPF